MTITIILCTYNRCKSLARTLDSVVALTLSPSVEWEVVVVDNNSSDRTQEVVAEFARSNEKLFRYIFEPRQGKSFALNTGIRAAQGEILAFLDDDVTVESHWLEQLTASLIAGEWAGTGGRILLDRPFSAPSWMPLDGPFGAAPTIAALFDLGNEARELKQAPYGTNMAFRKTMFEKYGLFRTDLGPRPGSEIRSEDTEFGRRLLAAGERLFYEPSSIVYHPLPEGRLCQGYVLNWWFDHGRAVIREKGKGLSMWGLPSGFSEAVKIIGRILPSYAIRWIFTVNQKERFRWKCAVWSTVGQIRETFRMAGESDRGRREYIPIISRGGADQ